jgi:hypothetical protein
MDVVRCLTINDWFDVSERRCSVTSRRRLAAEACALRRLAPGVLHGLTVGIFEPLDQGAKLRWHVLLQNMIVPSLKGMPDRQEHIVFGEIEAIVKHRVLRVPLLDRMRTLPDLLSEAIQLRCFGFRSGGGLP